MSSLYSVPKTESKQFNTKCVCQICKCGNHKCPSGISSYSPNILLTTHKKDYVPWPIQNNSNCKEKANYQQITYNPDLIKSQYQTAYVPFQVPRGEHKNRNEYQKDNIPFNSSSEYKTVYQPFQSSPNQSQKRLSKASQLNVPFKGTSTYREDFRKFQQSYDSFPRRKGDIESMPPQVGFFGDSTYKMDYTQFQSTPPKSMKEPLRPTTSVPFDGTSQYKTAFRGFDPRIYQNDSCPVQQLPKRPVQLSPGKSHLNFNSQTNSWE